MSRPLKAAATMASAGRSLEASEWQSGPACSARRGLRGPAPGASAGRPPFEAPAGAGPCQLQPGTALAGPRSPCRRHVGPRARPEARFGGRRAGLPELEPPGPPGRRLPGPFGSGMGRDPGTIRSCRRRLARLAPMDAKAGPAPGPEADPALGGAAPGPWQATLVSAATEQAPARDFGRGASRLVYAAPILRSSPTILGDITDDRR